MKKYHITHKSLQSAPYHPPSNGRVELANKEIKQLEDKTNYSSCEDWSFQLVDPLCAYHTAYKTPLGMSLYRIVYQKKKKLVIYP